MANGVTLPSNAHLWFSHAFEFEYGSNSYYDGGVLEYSTNGGSSWVDAGSLFAEGKNYGGTLSTAYSNPVGGRSAFVAASHGYVSSRYNLSTLAGQSVRFRWRVGSDVGGSALGWYVDDVKINACAVVTGPAVSLSPTSLSFGSQNIGSTSAAQSITLSNTGSAMLSIANIAASGDYARGTTCGATLAAGANCSISVTFTPTAAGTRIGAITVTSDASGSPHSVSLSGTGLTVSSLPDLVVTSLTAPSTGTSGGQITISATVANQGAASAGAFRMGFYFSTDALITTSDTASTSFCSITALAVGASSTCAGPITIPSSLLPGIYYFGAYADDLGAVSETSEINNTRSAQITLSGPSTYTLNVNSSGATGVAITSSTGHGGSTNYSKPNLTSGTSVQLTAPSSSGGANFSYWSGCDSVLAYSCTLSMTAIKTVTAYYTVGPTYTLSVSPTSLIFGSQNIGTTSAAQSITVSNTGSATLSIANIAASGDYARTTTCGITLAASANCTISVTFTPSAAGTRTGAITITSNATGSPHSVSLSGTGNGVFTQVPSCTLSASPLVITPGGAATLSASCTPAATSYAWTNSGFASNVSGGIVTPQSPTLYTVVGSNAGGSGNVASASVYLCNTSPLQTYAGQNLTGTDANDIFHSGIGNDHMDGGAGIDTVIYNCNRSSFTATYTSSGAALNSAAQGTGTLSVERPQLSIQPVMLDSSGNAVQASLVNQAALNAIANTSTGWTVSSAAEGVDTLVKVERLQFPNEILALDIDGNAGQAYRIYQAAFDRTPDNGGLKYWISVMDAGETVRSIAPNFINSDEFRSIYGTNPTPEQYVTRLYNNVLHRAPEQSGYDYWVNVLNNHWITYGDTLMYFSESAENQAGVLGAIINGIDLLN